MVRLPLFVELIPKNLKEFKKDVKVETELSSGRGGRVAGGTASQTGLMAGIADTVGDGNKINMSMLGKMAGLVAGVSIVANALMSLKPVTAMLEMVTKIISLFFLPFVMMAFRLLKPFLIGMMKLMMLWYKFWQDPIGNLSKLFDETVAVLTGLGGFIVNGLTGILSGVGEGITNLGKGISDTAGNIFDGQVEIATKAKELIGNFIGNTFGEEAQGHYNTVFTKAMEVISGIGSFMDNLLKGNFELAFKDILGIGLSILEMLNSLFLLEWEVLEGIGIWMWKGLTDIFTTTWKVLTGFGQWILDSISTVLTKSFEVLSNLGSKIVNWVMKNLGDIISGGGDKPKPMGDFVVTPSGTIQTHPNDYIIGTKNPGLLGGGRANITNNIHIHVTGFMDDEVANVLIEKMTDEMSRRMSF